MAVLAQRYEQADMRVVELRSGDKAEAFTVLDDLRAAIESGHIVCFAAVGIDKADGTMMWLANIGKAKTMLQLMGAISNLMMQFWNGDIK